jgi:hypothetical protein
MCARCDAYSVDCEHTPGRMLVWHRLIADVAVEPHPETSDFKIDAKVQLSGFLGALQL